jgi:hypothetical protein
VPTLFYSNNHFTLIATIEGAFRQVDSGKYEIFENISTGVKNGISFTVFVKTDLVQNQN